MTPGRLHALVDRRMQSIADDDQLSIDETRAVFEALRRDLRRAGARAQDVRRWVAACAVSAHTTTLPAAERHQVHTVVALLADVFDLDDVAGAGLPPPSRQIH